jgi:hypothetical protein
MPGDWWGRGRFGNEFVLTKPLQVLIRLDIRVARCELLSPEIIP